MSGYLLAIMTLEPRGDGHHDDVLVHPAVQPVRDARAADGRPGRALGGRGCRSRSWSSAVVFTAIVATRMYAAGRAALRAAAGDPHVHRGGASRRLSAALRLVVQREPADQRQHRGGRRPSAAATRHPRRRSPGWPPRSATAGCGHPAGTGSSAAGRGSRRSPGRPPRRRGRGPRWRWPGPRRTSSPGRRTRRSASRRLTSGWASSDRPSRSSTSNARNAAGGPPLPANRASSAAASARPWASTTTSSPSSSAERAATRTARPGELGERRGQVGAVRVDDPDLAGARQVGRADRRPARAGRPTTARRGARPSRTASGSGRGSIGRRSGRSGRRSVSSRSESWSDIVARW